LPFGISPFVTIFQEIESLFPAALNAFLASSSGIPFTSNITVPFLTTATHLSGAPLPEPIRTSNGFLVNDICGKILIHIFPVLPNLLLIAILAASICLESIQAPSVAINPHSPKATYELPFALPS
jgi:hypothetical protein